MLSVVSFFHQCFFFLGHFLPFVLSANFIYEQISNDAMFIVYFISKVQLKISWELLLEVSNFICFFIVLILLDLCSYERFITVGEALWDRELDFFLCLEILVFDDFLLQYVVIQFSHQVDQRTERRFCLFSFKIHHQNLFYPCPQIRLLSSRFKREL